uniref:Uncharacterized protein n=1 Tax=Magallana gigas TaxID=29159 RepID=A0A8W8J2E2_MAGGI
MRNILQNVLRLLLQPLFPMSRRNTTLRDGEIVSKLFLSHVFAGIVVLFGVLSGQKAVVNEVFFGKWTVIILCICVGILAALSLLISSCRQRQDVHITAEDEDPSINLQLVFLWGFGLAILIYLSTNVAIYIQCAIDRPDDLPHSIFLLLVTVLYILFTVCQVVLLTYNKRSILKPTIQFHFSIVCILAVNFALWYSSTMHTLFATGNKTTGIQNRSCYHSSEIQKRLGRKLSLILLPPQMEFYILASTLLISLWLNSKQYGTSETTHGESVINEHYLREPRAQSSTGVNGKHVLAVILGVVINIPIVISVVLLDFAYEWQNTNVITSFDVSETLSSILSFIILCVSYHKIGSNSVITIRTMLLRDYILILSSTGEIAFLMVGLLESITGSTVSAATLVNRICGMLEIFLQTHLLISTNRQIGQEFRSGSSFISSCAMILVVSNLTYWLLDSYNKYYITSYRYIHYKDLNVVNLLIPLVTFYRFFSAMAAYSMYKRYKPN